MPFGRTYGIGRGGGLGYGRGQGGGLGYGRGMCFGFRDMSPPWPYIGRGRGGLPRCGYYLNYLQPSVPYTQRTSLARQTTPAQEVDFLKKEAALLKRQLEKAKARINALEKNEDS